MSGLIILEGPDGAGKSTVAAALVSKLDHAGARPRLVGLPGNCPGTLGRLVHQLHHDSTTHSVNAIHPASLQLLHASAHIDAIHTQIRPAIEAGETVVLDRFWWSTIVYGRATGVDEQTLLLLERLARTQWAFVVPTIAYVFLTQPIISAPDLFHQIRSQYITFLDALRETFPITTIFDQGVSADDRADEILMAWQYHRQNSRT